MNKFIQKFGITYFRKNKHTQRQTHRQTHTHKDRHTHTKTDRQADRHKDTHPRRQTHRQSDRCLEAIIITIRTYDTSNNVRTEIQNIVLV